MAKIKPTVKMRVGRAARKAAEIMDERGWVRGKAEDPLTGQVCLLGAFDRATRPLSGPQRNVMTANFGRLFSDWMTDNYPDPRGGMTSWPSGWNDTVLESKEETVAWLGKFADAMDPQQ